MDKPFEKPVKVDFCRRETERGWQRILDRFGLTAAPIWFDWLEWILVLGAFEYLAKKSGSRLAQLAPGISIALLWFYFNGFFFRMEFKGWFRIRSRALEVLLSLAVSSFIATGFWLAAQIVAGIIAENTK
jgi:hypothetical protein